MNNSQITVYGINPYDRSGKVSWLLTELGVKFENVWIDTESNGLESPEYLKVNPLGRVPAIKIDDRSMFESGAICSYLADRYIEKGMAPKLSAPERLDYEQWMYFAASTVDTFIIRMMVVEDIPAGEVHENKMKALMDEVEDSFLLLEKVLSKQDFLVANKFSTADICVSYHLYFCSLWPEYKAVLDKHSHLTKYLGRLKNLPSAKASKVFSYED